jgi:ATP-dependent DNA helicase UvrD/PcrA
LKKLLQSLNPEQRDAVETTEGPVLVLAGAGSGKTRVITYRMAHLLQKRVPPSALLAMTFTNKAAGEMRDRVAALVGKKRAEELTVGTFHAFCLNALRNYKEVMGWPAGFTLADASDQLSLLKGALRELRIAEARLRPQELQSRISLAKNKLDTPEKWLARPGDDAHELVGRAWQKYQALLQRSRRLDFDDLLTETLRLLREHPEVLAAARERFRYLLVDEYQDTNGPQYEILRHLAGERRNLCVVGDDDQSIYGWRGADISKILSFEKHYPGAKVVKLETNYRSTQAILTIANRLIAHNVGRHEKTLRSALGPGDPPTAVCMRDEDTEAEQIVAQIQERVREGAHYDDFAILFRAATQARPFEAELRMKEIPYDLVGGLSFFDRKEVRDVLAYLKLIANPKDETSLLRIINCPPRGVGKTTIERALAFATDEGISIADAFGRADEIEKINRDAVAAVLRLLERMKALRAKFPKGAQLVELVERLVEEVAYRGEVDRVYPDKADADKRWQGVTDVMNFAENYVRRRKRPGLLGFLNELSLSQSDRYEKKGERQLRVTLMSLHASKGLEYPHVYLVGVEEGLLPHVRAVAEDTIEEERRLTYVGVTRAKAHLTISWCAQRARAGHRIQCHPSRFLLEIQGKQPPADWEPAGEGDPTGSKNRRKKRQVKKRRRRARP